MMKWTRAYTVALALTALSSNSYGVGFGFEYQSVEMSARGNTAVAHTQHAAAAHYNPAALSFMESASFEFNAFTIHGESQWSTGGATYKTDDEVKVSGSLFYAKPFKWMDKDWAFGIALTRPYGQSVDWPSDTPARNSGYSGELDFPQFGLALSHRVNDSLGFGATLNYSPSQLKTSGGVALPTDSLSFDGEEDSFSAHFGVLYQPVDELRFGLSYRTGFDVSYEGSFDYNSNFPGIPNSSSNGNLDFSMPSHVVFGLEYDLNQQWTVAAQSQWTEWSVVDNFAYQTGGVEQVTPVNWNNGWIHSLGATYSCNQDLDLHFGYMYTASIIDNEYQTLLHADFDQHFLSCGASYEIMLWEAQVALVYVITEDKTVQGSIYAADGDHSGDGFFVNLGASRSF